LSLQAQFTFTGEVRQIQLVDNEVWAATGGGLAIHRRSDGAHLRTLTSGDGLPGNSLRSLARLNRQQVMVGSDFGLAVIDVGQLRAGRPSVRTLDASLRFDPVSAIQVMGSDVLVLRQQSGLHKWTLGKAGNWTHQPQPVRGSWRALAAGPVLGGMDGRILIQDGAGTELASFALGAPVLALQARGPDVIAATGEKLLQVRPSGVQTLVDSHTHRPVVAGALSQDGDDVLVGTAHGEVFGLRNDQLGLLVSGLPGRITALAADGPRVWLGVGRNGLYVATPGQSPLPVRPVTEICDNHVVSVLKFAGRMVAATFDQGACFLDERGWHPLAPLPSPLVHGLGSDGQDLYVATSNGLARFDARLQLRPFDRHDPPVLRWTARSAATALVSTADGVAITSVYGLVQVRRDGQKLTATYTSHKAGVPRKLTGVAAAGGELWLASETQGVQAMGLGGHAPRHLQDPEDLPENWVTAVAATGDNLWVGTCQRGLARVQSSGRPLSQGTRTGSLALLQGSASGQAGQLHTQFIDKRTLLPDNMVVALAADERGAFVGTLGGLTFVAAEGLNGKSFGWEAGLPDPRSAALLLATHELWLGTEAGLARYGLR
jgi:hypothetical protein